MSMCSYLIVRKVVNSQQSKSASQVIDYRLKLMHPCVNWSVTGNNPCRWLGGPRRPCSEHSFSWQWWGNSEGRIHADRNQNQTQGWFASVVQPTVALLMSLSFCMIFVCIPVALTKSSRVKVGCRVRAGVNEHSEESDRFIVHNNVRLCAAAVWPGAVHGA